MRENITLEENHYRPTIAKKTLKTYVWDMKDLRYEQAIFGQAKQGKMWRFEISTYLLRATSETFLT